MHRSDFQRLAAVRIREARTLLGAGMFDGGYYLAGYSIECALKSCIAKRTRKNDFPDKDFVRDCYTHSLEALIKHAGLKPALEAESKRSKPFELNWAVVKDWTEESRYGAPVPEAKARALLSAITAPRVGLLPWIRKRW